MADGSDTPPADTVSSAIRRNVAAVAKLEAAFLEERSRTDRIADAIGSFTGSLKFVAVHFLIYGLWIAVNTGLLPGFYRFDPYPFLLLSMLVSLEAIFLSTFLLMKQNRMSRREDLRAHLDLQVNLLAEKEMTMMLQMLQRISTRLGIRLAGTEVEELIEETSLEVLASELREKLPEE